MHAKVLNKRLSELCDDEDEDQEESTLTSPCSLD